MIFRAYLYKNYPFADTLGARGFWAIKTQRREASGSSRRFFDTPRQSQSRINVLVQNLY